MGAGRDGRGEGRGPALRYPSVPPEASAGWYGGGDAGVQIRDDYAHKEGPRGGSDPQEEGAQAVKYPPAAARVAIHLAKLTWRLADQSAWPDVPGDESGGASADRARRTSRIVLLQHAKSITSLSF
jgi:hypothetical protein